MYISAKSMGVMIGFAFGVVWMTLGLGPALISAAIAIGGNIVGWVIDGVTEGRVSAETLWNDLHSPRHLT